MDDDTDIKGGSSQDLDGIIGGSDSEFDDEDLLGEPDLGLDEEDW